MQRNPERTGQRWAQSIDRLQSKSLAWKAPQWQNQWHDPNSCCHNRHNAHRLRSFTLADRSVCKWLANGITRRYVKAVRSNKLLGAFGQGIAIPSVGYPISTSNPDLHDTIVIIVSHSGGTFAPLACSSLLQCSTKNVFIVASEWDTQIRKQLRSMTDKGMTASHIFSTDIGLRPAEPCTIIVATTQQLLTLIFEHIFLTIFRKKQYRHWSQQ